MPVMQRPNSRIEVSDPNSVPEVYVSGPFNVMNAEGMVHLTFTTARPDPNDLFRGSTTPEFHATVACRLLMPLEMALKIVQIWLETPFEGGRHIRRIQLIDQF